GGLEMVQVIPVGENAAIALGRGFGERRLPAPALNDGAFRESGAEHFVPADHDFAVGVQDLLHAVVEVVMDGCDIGELVIPGKRLDGFRLAPLGGLHLIAADMKYGSGKSAAISPRKPSRNLYVSSRDGSSVGLKMPQ